MAAISGIEGSGSTKSVELAMEYQARVLKMQKDALNMQGEMALELINAVAAPSSAGHQIDVRA